jgi:2',3'-cyclic-nucleotide 2'-phosphodiesterase (5'-nucleotidase family)
VRRLALATGLLLVAACVSNAPPPIPLKPVRFLLINDVQIADTLPNGRGGLARVATVRNRLADQGPILYVLAGNVLGSGSSQLVEVYNRSQVNFATFGEQELNLGPDSLTARVAESKFTWVSSNCTRPDGTPLAKVLPWDTLRVSGYKVGLFGVTLEGQYPPGIRCSDPDSAAHRTIETLTADSADLIVAITHQTTDADRNLLVREPKLELILGGHVQKATDSVVSGRHAVKADENAASAQFVTLWGGKEGWREAVGLVPIDGSLPADTAVAPAIPR